MVTVAYERIRGLRDTGQQRESKDYHVNKSKTVPVPIEELYAAFGARPRKQWMGDVDLKVRKATREKSMRITWEDGSNLDVYFWEKGAAKSQVTLQHKGHASKAAADKRRAWWTDRLADLAAYARIPPQVNQATMRSEALESSTPTGCCLDRTSLPACEAKSSADP